MLESKEQLILEVALSFFSEKGYYTTSVQEIATQCGISKGSLYKFFQSKEDLFIKVCEYHQNQLFKKARVLDYQDYESSKAWLKDHIALQMEDFLQKKDFIFMQFKEIPFHKSEKLKSLKTHMRSRIMNWRYESLLTAYGKEIEPFIWDVMIMLQGMIKESLFLIIESKQYALIKPAANFIANRIDSTITQLSEQKEVPVVTDAVVKKYISIEKSIVTDTIESVLGEMKLKVQAISNDEWRKKLLDTISLLLEEITKEHQRSFLMEALLSYLEKEDQLVVLVKKARNFI
ncbi:TetR/AcrR family transcriptional regulator [Bacillus sp. FJAT-47783]|uniref:TetR/AcrR family transcriptional regulator n=1 Tax=Bacillus sp. FJAT-47783 TaxID=2922712 RepID=UPI001FAC1801|nr:TetR/AcrR family transcriptional regulator [Bacillus sp. FJAT-47783]